MSFEDGKQDSLSLNETLLDKETNRLIVQELQETLPDTRATIERDTVSIYGQGVMSKFFVDHDMTVTFQESDSFDTLEGGDGTITDTPQRPLDTSAIHQNRLNALEVAIKNAHAPDVIEG